MKKNIINRILSLALCAAMLITSMPLYAFAEEYSLVTNADEYALGEEIIVRAASDDEGSKVALYQIDDELSVEPYAWYIVNGTEGELTWVSGEAYTLDQLVKTERMTEEHLPEGDYKFVLLDSEMNVLAEKTFKINAVNEQVKDPAEELMEEPAVEIEEPVEEPEEEPIVETEEPVEELEEEPVVETEEPVEEPEEELVVDTEELVENEEEFASYVNYFSYETDSRAASGVVVKATKSEISVRITNIGTNGTAQLYSCNAEEYFTADKMSGMSKKVGFIGTIISDYTCGTDAEITFNRYNIDGTDNLYKKYYVIQDNKVVAGPYYASEIASLRARKPFEQATKKGLTAEIPNDIETALAMGISNTVINMDLCDLILANEDADGNPIDNSKRGDVIEFESNGETFYFNQSYVHYQDGAIAEYSRNKINVTLVLIAWAKTYTKEYPSSLLYIPANQNNQTMGFNTSTALGRKYWIAAMEFMANRYSQSNNMLVDKYIVGNEIDYTYDWYLMQPNTDQNGKYQRVEFNTFMEEYARTLRLANLAVKKYNSEAKVLVSLTHNWAYNCHDSYNINTTKYPNNIRLNSYAPKDICDWLLKYEKARGDYNWGLSVHPYPIGTTASNPVKTDAAYTGIPDTHTGNIAPITGDWKKSPWITAANLELYQLYLEQPEALCNGELRTVSITETSICTDNTSTTSLNEQAASVAQYYYRAACIDCIDAIAYFQLHDQSTTLKYPLGLMTVDGVKKPAYNVWKYVDTDKSFNYSQRYLKYIDADADSYLDIMPAVKSDFNWNEHWDLEKIMARKIEAGDTVRSLITDKDTYGANDPILVTATGDIGDVVGLYLKSDDIDKAEPIYSYLVHDTSGTIKLKSGNTYDLLAYGSVSVNRVADSYLNAGDYQVVLRRGDTDETIIKDIKITSNYSFGSTEYSLKTNKNEYSVGEEIIVTATGNTNCWAGLYKKGDRYGSGGVVSIYWYWVNYESEGHTSGKPTILQTTTHSTSSSNPSSKLAAGDYVLYLFDGTGGNDYNVVKSIELKVIANEISPLKDFKYELENATDGFANGTVTVTKDVSNDGATDCIMFWADENGNPLTGYNSLAKFKLEETTTIYTMTPHTIIPEGAKKLIAYASDGFDLSETALSVTLPENCSYILDDEVLVEFQVISDTHTTLANEAVNEVKYSNTHFTNMLEDVREYSPESIGIFVNGDVVNNGRSAQYQEIYNMYNKVKYADSRPLPYLHVSIGNHDWLAGNPNNQFQKVALMLNPTLQKAPENLYYHEEVAGYHFIYLGGEAPGDRAVLSNEQLDWFDMTMMEITKENPDQPVFVLLHQSMYNTVSGSLSGQGWDGVVTENALKKIVKKYGQIVLFNGHSHWVLDSEANMFAGDDEHPVAFNTASVSYLWTSYDVITGEHEDGSEGYYVRVYDDKIVLLGRDFENHEFNPSAMYVVEKNKVETAKDEYKISLDSTALNLNATAVGGGEVSYLSTNSAIASVTEDGTVIPKADGIVDIIITSTATNTKVMDRKTVTIEIGGANAYRIYGQTRYETAFDIANQLKETLNVDKFDTVIIASGENFADALAGSYLAAKKNAPILITNGKNKADLQRYIQENVKPGGVIYILGGTKAVSDNVVQGLNGYAISRLAGEDRYETNLKILKEAGVSGEDVLIATGKSFADSLSASASKRPILLVSGKLNKDQKQFLESLNGNKLYILGGDKAVSASIENELMAYGEVTRIGGATRYETSKMIADTFSAEASSAVLAYAQKFPDGLCGGALASALDAPLLLVANGSEDAAKTYMIQKGIKNGVVLGGTILISDQTVRNVFGLDASTAIIKK